MTDTGFEPARLRQARELRQWSQAEVAGKIPVTPAAIGQFESGSTRPSRETVDKLAAALEVPTAFLSLPIRETHEGFFRSNRKTPVGHRRRARAIAHIAHDLTFASDRLPDVDLPDLAAPALDATREDIEDIAGAVRRYWKMPAGPVAHVVRTLEDHGIIVLRLPLDTGDVDAFSLPFDDRPVVVLSADKQDRARSRFDAAHELGHLILHGERIWGLKEVEDQAHWFAAAFLMPADEIRDQLPERADWTVLFNLKATWQISLAALLMRAKKLKKMSDANYLSAVKAVSARGWRRQEPVPLGEPERPRLIQHIMATGATAPIRSALPSDIVGSILAANRT